MPLRTIFETQLHDEKHFFYVSSYCVSKTFLQTVLSLNEDDADPKRTAVTLIDATVVNLHSSEQKGRGRHFQ